MIVDLKNLILVLILLSACSRNERPPEFTEDQLKQQSINVLCKRIREYRTNNRFSYYPYNKASEVHIISFYSNNDGENFTHSIPINDGKLDSTKITERKVLSEVQIDSLTDILFNHGYSGKVLTEEGVGCYNPRKGILFFNEKHELFEYMEICFECNGFRASSDEMNIGENCSEKYDLIKNFFARSGIEIGTIKEIRHPR